MLVGSEIGAVLTSLQAMRPDVLGINCATGPAEMQEHLRYLSQHSPVPDQRAAQRRPAEHRRRSHPLRPHARAARRVPPPPRHRPRHRHRRRLLRHHARAPPPGGRSGAATSRRCGARRSSSRASRSIYSPVTLDQDTERADHRRAHERQRFQGVPRRDARRRLGRVHEDGHASRSARARTCSTSASTTSVATAPPTWTRSPALRHPGQRPAGARQHRAAGARGRA